MVQQNYVKLLEHLDTKSSVDLFFGSSFITADTLERVDKATTRKDANKVLVNDLLQGISPSQFSRFVSLLRESADKYKRPRHKALADELERDLKVSCHIVFCPRCTGSTDPTTPGSTGGGVIVSMVVVRFCPAESGSL